MNEIDWHPNENQHFCCCCCYCGWWRIKCRLISFYLQLFCVLSLNFMWAFIDCLFSLTFHGFFSVNMRLLPDAQASKHTNNVRFKCVHKYIYFIQIALPYPRSGCSRATPQHSLARWRGEKEGQTRERQKVLQDSSPYRINVVKASTLCIHTQTDSSARAQTHL